MLLLTAAALLPTAPHCCSLLPLPLTAPRLLPTWLQVLVETAMLSAVSGLAFLLSTLLKLDNSLGCFLPLPIAIAACRSGVAAAWHTMMATAFLLLGG